MPYVGFKINERKLYDVQGFIPKIIEWLAEKYHFT